MPPQVYRLTDEAGIVTFVGTISPPPGGGSQPFAPTDLIGQRGIDLAPLTLALWLDASDAATIHTGDAGGRVSKWDDKSGSGNDAVQADTSAQPTTGVGTIGDKNALGFDGTAYYLAAPVADATEAQFEAVVFKAGAVDLDSFNYALLGDATAFLRLNNSADDPQLQNNDVGVSLDPTVVHYGMRVAQTNYGVLGGALIADAGAVLDAAPWTVSAPLLIGACDDPADSFFLGGIAEVIHVTGYITPVQVQSIIDYLVTKWSIA